jgi:hypothetical protein
MNKFGKALDDILTKCIADGMKYPLLLCAAGAESSHVLVARVHQSGETELLTEAPPGRRVMMKAPINVMVVDKNGEAVHTKLNAPNDSGPH